LKVNGKFPFAGLPDEAKMKRFISRYYQDAGSFKIPGQGIMQYAGGGWFTVPVR